MYLRLNIGQQIFICSANIYQMTYVPGSGRNRNEHRSVPSFGEILSLEVKGTLGVSVCQKGDKLPKNIVVSTTAQEPHSTMEYSGEKHSSCLQEGEKLPRRGDTRPGSLRISRDSLGKRDMTRMEGKMVQAEGSVCKGTKISRLRHI